MSSFGTCVYSADDLVSCFSVILFPSCGISPHKCADQSGIPGLLQVFLNSFCTAPSFLAFYTKIPSCTISDFCFLLLVRPLNSTWSPPLRIALWKLAPRPSAGFSRTHLFYLHSPRDYSTVLPGVALPKQFHAFCPVY